jgi:hypothetical protein
LVLTSAPADYVGAVLEILAVAFLTASQIRRTLEEIELWDKVSARSTDEPWADELKTDRNAEPHHCIQSNCGIKALEYMGTRILVESSGVSVAKC